MLSIFVVPSIGLSRPSEWLDPSGASWLHRLVKDVVPQGDIWEYVYPQSRTELHSKRILEEGLTLLHALYRRCSTQEVSKQLSSLHLTFANFIIISALACLLFSSAMARVHSC